MITYEVDDLRKGVEFYSWFQRETPEMVGGDVYFAKRSFRLIQGNNPNRDVWIGRQSDDIGADHLRLLEMGATLQSPCAPDPKLAETDYEYLDLWGNTVVMRSAGSQSEKSGDLDSGIQTEA